MNSLQNTKKISKKYFFILIMILLFLLVTGTKSSATNNFDYFKSPPSISLDAVDNKLDDVKVTITSSKKLKEVILYKKNNQGKYVKTNFTIYQKNNDSYIIYNISSSKVIQKQQSYFLIHAKDEDELVTEKEVRISVNSKKVNNKTVKYYTINSAPRIKDFTYNPTNGNITFTVIDGNGMSNVKIYDILAKKDIYNSSTFSKDTENITINKSKLKSNKDVYSLKITSKDNLKTPNTLIKTIEFKLPNISTSNQNAYAQSIKLNATNIQLDISKPTYQLTASISPANASNNISWKSSKKSVVTVNNNGLLKRAGPGTATITAKTTDGSNKTATCTVTVKEEKVIIIGGSTTVQLASRRKCSSNSADYCHINYYNDYGYTVRATSTQANKYYSFLAPNYALTNTSADLFFVALGGSGYYWITGDKPQDYYSSVGTPGQANMELYSILKANPNCHFTIAFMHGGNDLKKATSEAQVDEISNTFFDYYKSLAVKYPEHTIYVFPMTPIDTAHARGELKKSGYKALDSNNTKRSKFTSNLQSLVNSASIANLKFANTFFDDLKNNPMFSTYDGKHYDKSTTKLVLNEMLKDMDVLNSTGKKK